MADDNFTYYRRRLAEEVKAANSATCAVAAGRHRQLAERYAALTGNTLGDGSTTELSLSER